MGLRRAEIACLLLAGLPLAGPGAQAGALPAWAPEHVRLQFAGTTGLLSLGTGYGLWGGRLEPGVMYGYVPAKVGGLDIHTVAQRTAIAPLRMHPLPGTSLYPLVFGYAANFALGRRYDLLLERRFRGYYWPSALHFWIFAGAKARREIRGAGPIRGITAMAEVGTLEAYLEPALRNQSVTLGDILSLSFSLQAHR